MTTTRLFLCVGGTLDGVWLRRPDLPTHFFATLDAATGMPAFDFVDYGAKLTSTSVYLRARIRAKTGREFVVLLAQGTKPTDDVACAAAVQLDNPPVPGFTMHREPKTVDV